MSNRVECVLENNKNGYNCAQSVFLAYCDIVDFNDKEKACMMLSGMGSGVGRTNNICGALNALALLIGLKIGAKDANEIPEKGPQAYIAVGNAIREFKGKFGSSYCTELVGYDLSEPENVEKAKASNVFVDKCRNMYMKGAAEIADRALGLEVNDLE